MAKGAKPRQFNNIQIILLLPVWLLIKIGSLPLLPFKIISHFVRNIIRYFLSAVRKKSNSKLQSLTTNHLLRLHHRRRGRPRTTPLMIYLSHKFKRIFRKILPSPLRAGIVLGIIALILFVYSFILINVSRDLPSPEKLANDTSPLTTEFYDRNGQLLYRLYEGRNRTLVKLSDIPPLLVDATISIEDKNFWGHKGVDPLGTARALISDTTSENLQGGSTITQQLIKNTLLTTDRTWQRKAKEILLAFWTERLFNKNQILEMYFNQVPYGGPAWGVEAASETYFQKGVTQLDLAESAYLAGLPASPTSFSPFGPHPELGKERQKEVLRRMVEDKYITETQADSAYSENLIFRPPISSIKAPHFVMYVRDLLAQKYGEREVSQGGLKIYTSLDLNTQSEVQQIVADQISKLDNLHVTNGAAMVEDPRTGQILAMVGSKDYFDPAMGNFNVALAPRQPGSSIKVITYSTAFKQGYSPGTVLIDAPTNFNGYAPVNYDGKFHGAVTIRTALGSSFNIPAVKTLALEGIPNFLSTAHDMGITTLNDPERYGLSLTLGGGEVKLIDMMTVYSTLSQMGQRHDPNPILKVTDSKGEVLEDNTTPYSTQVLPPGVAFMITDILADNVARTPAFGPKSLLVIPNHTVAVKTGTTDSKRDNWTFGYTPNLVVGVWVGNNDNTPMDQSLTSGVTGAAPIWNQIMTTLLSNQPNLVFTKPPDVTLGWVDGHQDLVITGNGSKSVASSKEQDNTITYSDPFGSVADSSAQVR